MSRRIALFPPLLLALITYGMAGEALRIGDPAPDFPAALQAPVQLSALRGKAVVLYLYAVDAGCPTCEEDLLHLRRLVRRHRGRLQTVVISDAQEKDIQAFRKGIHRRIPIVRDPSSVHARTYLGKIKVLPYIVILNSEGIITWMGRNLSLADITEEVERALKASSPPKARTPGGILHSLFINSQVDAL
ncbi:MAG: peroxiredoxin family protein, partial [Planctomycetota bacterium]